MQHYCFLKYPGLKEGTGIDTTFSNMYVLQQFILEILFYNKSSLLPKKHGDVCDKVLGHLSPKETILTCSLPHWTNNELVD